MKNKSKKLIKKFVRFKKNIYLCIAIEKSRASKKTP